MAYRWEAMVCQTNIVGVADGGTAGKLYPAIDSSEATVVGVQHRTRVVGDYEWLWYAAPHTDSTVVGVQHRMGVVGNYEWLWYVAPRTD